MQELDLVVPGVTACNVPEAESFIDGSEEEFRHDLVRNFFRHIPADVARMARRFPGETLASGDTTLDYVFNPHKALGRLFTLVGNFNNTLKGTDWEVLNAVADGHVVNVLGGALDPLMIAQRPQWQIIKNRNPDTFNVKELEGYGHTAPINARGVAAELAQMRTGKTSLQRAA
jgi:hypothetical protein